MAYRKTACKWCGSGSVSPLAPGADACLDFQMAALGAKALTMMHRQYGPTFRVAPRAGGGRWLLKARECRARRRAADGALPAT